MRKRRFYLVLMMVGVLVSGLVVCWPSGEPSYGGKRLSEWVLTLNRQNPESVQKEAEEAIRHIGDRAVPYLVKWMRYEMPAWKKKFYRDLNPMLGRFKFSNQNEVWRSILAGSALLNCGLDGEGAIGELNRLANNPNANGRIFGIQVLDGLGKPGLQALVGVLTNEQARAVKSSVLCVISDNAAGRLYFLDPSAARSAVPPQAPSSNEPWVKSVVKSRE